MANNEKYIHLGDRYRCIRNIADNSIGEKVVWRYVRDNWCELVNRSELNECAFSEVIPIITKHFSTRTELEEVEEFFGQNPAAGVAVSEQTLQRIGTNINWLDENKMKIENWSQKNIQAAVLD